MAKRSEIEEFVATTACCARIVPRSRWDRYHPRYLRLLPRPGYPEKLHAAVVTGPRNACEIFQRMEGRLTWGAQHVAVLAAIERHADGNSRTGAPTSPHRIHLLVDDICRHVPALKQIAVQPPEIAVDISSSGRPRFLVDSCRLAVAKELCCLLSFDLRHLADKIVAQRRKMRGGAAVIRPRCGRGRLPSPICRAC